MCHYRKLRGSPDVNCKDYTVSNNQAGGGDEMVGWHHRLNAHEFEQAPEDGEGQGNLACCSPRGHKKSDMTE